MNRKQRMKNRANALRIEKQPTCLECGQPGRHFVVPGLLGGVGFYVCDKFYGPDGRRLDTSDQSAIFG